MGKMVAKGIQQKFGKSEFNPIEEARAYTTHLKGEVPFN